MADLLVILRNALAHQRQGDLDSAERGYREVLRIEPRNFDALHLLGVIQTQRGNIDDAVRLLSLAVEVNSRSGDAYFHLAAAMVKKGDFRNALGTYDQAVRMFPNDAEMYFLRGTCCYHLQEYDAAVSNYDHAIALRPNYAEALDNRGAALYALERFEDAVVSYTQALCLNPKLIATYSNRGAALRKLQQWTAALADYDEALRLNGTIAEVYLNRGNVLRAMQRFTEAITSYERAIQLRPNFAEAFVNRGMVFRELNEFDAAVASCNAALALEPSNAEVYFVRGNALRDLKQLEEAEQAYKQATHLRPTYVEAFTNCGAVLCELKRNSEALECCERAIALDPLAAEAYCNRGAVLCQLNRDTEALECCDRAISLNPLGAQAYCIRGTVLCKLQDQQLELKSTVGYQDALDSLEHAIRLKHDFSKAFFVRGGALTGLGRIAEAKASLDQALAHNDEDPRIRYSRGWLELLLGQYQTGWVDYEYRWTGVDPKPVPLNTNRAWPTWQGEDLRGKSILVHREQGWGDQMQFVRYLQLLVLQGATVTYQTLTSGHRLLRSLTTQLRLVEEPDPRDCYDFMSPLLSLPRHFKTTLETIPTESPYLFAEPELAAAWSQRLGSGGFKVGVAWQGSPTSAADVGRSIPLRVYEKLASISGVRLISLQKNHGLEQLQDLPAGMKVETLGADFDNGPDAFIDTAAVMANLDLIITSDTSIAHLAGALGRPVWVALKYVPDWRWLLEREDSPWYPTMRLFRQKNHGNWAEVFSRIATALQQTVGLNSNQRH